MEKETTNLSLRKDIKERANAALDSGFFSGVGSLSGLVEKALEELLDRNHAPKTFEKKVESS
jgi:hypothetical protein